MAEHSAGTYYTGPAAAESVPCGTRSIYKAVARGELPASKINDRGDLRIHPDDLREWMRRRRVTALEHAAVGA